MNIGEKIRQRRNELGLSQRDLSKKLGYTSHTTLAKIEGGSIGISYSKIIQFAKVLDVSVNYLIGNSDDDTYENKKDSNSLGETIKKARLAKKLTQEELGVLLGVEKSAVAKYENGRIVNLKQSTLKKISKVLEIPISELISTDEDNVEENDFNEETPICNSRGAFAENLRFHIKRSGLTQREISEIVGVSNSTVNEWLKAKKYPRVEKLEKLANYFGITVPELVGEKATTKKKTATEIGKDEVLDIVIRLHTDEQFLNMVEDLLSLDDEKMAAFKQVLEAFKK